MNISVAMCTYNGSRHIEAQLESIARQTATPGEIVICDDGSSDSTLAMVESFAGRAPCPVRIHRNAVNLGYTKNFEQAIRLCEGDLIALSDQDDVWYPQKLAVLGAAMSDESAGGVFSDGDVIDEASQPVGRTLWESHGFTRREQEYFARGDYSKVLFRHNVVTGMTLMLRASLRERLLPIPKVWIHDGWLAFLIALESRLVACSERLVQYRIHSSQQVGAPLSTRQKFAWISSNGVGAFLRRSRSINLAEYEKTALRFAELRAYLHGRGGNEDVEAGAAAKAEFAQAMVGAFGGSRLARASQVIRRAGDYHRYSFVKGMLRDLVI